MVWPTKSSDLNPIEKLWKIISDKRKSMTVGEIAPNNA